MSISSDVIERLPRVEGVLNRHSPDSRLREGHRLVFWATGATSIHHDGCREERKPRIACLGALELVALFPSKRTSPIVISAFPPTL